MSRRIACAAAILFWMQSAVAQDVLGPPTAQVIPAHPDLDLAAPTKFLWLHKADAATIQQKIAAGHRLTRISTVSSSPPLFTAVFVKNAGAFAGSTKLRTNLTQSQLFALNTPTTRVADIAVYQASDKTRRYAAVVVKNGPKKTSLLVVDSPSIADLKATVAASKGRIVDLELEVKKTPPTFAHKFFAVVITSVEDRRKQCIVPGNVPGNVVDLDRAIFSNDPCTSAAVGQRYPKWRMVTAVAEDAALLKSQAAPDTPVDEFYAVLEELKPGEYGWWNANLDHNPSKQPMRDLGRVAWYLDGRYADLKPYVSTGGALKYLGMLIDNASKPLPITGAQTATDAFFKPFTDTFVKNMRHFGETGGTVAVRKKGRLIYAKAFGYSSLGSSDAARCYGSGASECAGAALPVRVPATETMQFRVASVSKTVAGIAITKLIEEGKLSFSTHPFGEIFEAAKPPSSKLNQIQIRHLLAHTAGLKDGFDDQHGRIDETTLGGKLYDENDWLRLLNEDLPNAPGADGIGKVEKYNNAHYMLLGRIVQKLTGDDTAHGYMNYIEAKLMTPVQAIRIGPTTLTPSSGPVFPEPSYYGPPGDESSHAWERAGTGIVSEGALDLRLARGNLTAAPLDLLRLYGGADGSLNGFARTVSLQRWLELLHTVPDNQPTTYKGTHILGFKNSRPAPSCTSTDLTQCAPNVTLRHGGLHNGSAGGLVKLWPDGLGTDGLGTDGLGVVAAFNTDYLWSHGEEGVGNAGNNVQDELEDFAKLQSSWPENDFFPAYVGKP